ncbi:MAG: SAM-dependent methyltransferase [Myxococcaceae bacterium]
MTPALPISLLTSGIAEEVLGTEVVLRRVLETARLSPESRILVLGGSGSLATLLAHKLRMQVLVADADESRLEGVTTRAAGQAWAKRFETQHVDFDALPFGPSEFAAIFVLDGWRKDAAGWAGALRNLLAPQGRLLCLAPFKVGRAPAEALVQHLEARWGSALGTPTDFLRALARSGFEPELVETLSEAELEARFAGLRRGATYAEELSLYDAHGPRFAVTFGLAMGRKREPGEKPPAARDRG